MMTMLVLMAMAFAGFAGVKSAGPAWGDEMFAEG